MKNSCSSEITKSFLKKALDWFFMFKRKIITLVINVQGDAFHIHTAVPDPTELVLNISCMDPITDVGTPFGIAWVA